MIPLPDARGVLLHDYERGDIGFFKKLSVIKERCNNDAYADLYDGYPYNKLKKSKMFLYLGMKYRQPLLIFAILWAKQMLKK